MTTQQVAHTYTPRPLIMWKLSKIASSQIECGNGCKRHARYGYSADGGAPYVYVCSKHVPIGVPVHLCANSAEIEAEVKARASGHLYDLWSCAKRLLAQDGAR